MALAQVDSYMVNVTCYKCGDKRDYKRNCPHNDVIAEEKYDKRLNNICTKLSVLTTGNSNYNFHEYISSFWPDSRSV